MRSQVSDEEPKHLDGDAYLILRFPSGVVCLLKSLLWIRAPHVSGLGGREERDVAQSVDAFLPFLAGFVGWVNELDA